MFLETTNSLDRRFAPRWVTNKPIAWRPHHGRKVRYAQLTQRSLNSFAFLASESDAPRIGALLHPADLTDELRHGFRLAVVRRIQDSNQGQLVFAEILS
ncbi:MAG: hypothetical protein ABSF29_10215 [Tepidisphaeraceae bacterium]